MPARKYTIEDYKKQHKYHYELIHRLRKKIVELERPETEKDKEIKRLNKKVMSLYRFGRTQTEKSDDERLRTLFKTPKYYYSFSGLAILRAWYISHGLTMEHARGLILMSYFEYLTMEDCHKWGIYKKNWRFMFKILIDKGLVSKERIKWNRQVVYALTLLGKSMEQDYERFYDKAVKQLKVDTNKLTFHAHNGHKKDYEPPKKDEWWIIKDK